MTPDDATTAPRLARRAAALTAVVSGVLLVALAVLLVPWSWVPGGHLVAMRPDQLFTPAQIARAEDYSTTVRWLSLTAYGLSIALALLLGLTPLGARLVRATTRRLPWWVAVPVGTLLVLLAGRLLTLPFDLAVRHQQLRFGLTHQRLGAWSVDALSSLLVSWVTWSLVLLVVVLCARRSPRFWFAWAGASALLLTLAGSFLYPVVVEPLFNSFTPMPPGPFRSAVFALARKEGVHINEVLVADASRRTTTVNAYVSGFGSTRRVVVYDTMLTELTPAEGRIVVAHELGHAKHNDVLLGTALGAVGTLFAVTVLALVVDVPVVRRRAGVASIADPAAVALLLALTALGGFLVSPVQNSVSRAIEARADRAALAATGQGNVFVKMQRELAVRSLNDPDPPAITQFWFGTHPTAVQRAGLPASLAAARR